MKNANTYRGSAYGLLIFLGIVAFDVFNFATTRDALGSFLANSNLWGVPLKDALAIAFCAVDLGGVASIFTKEKGLNEPWYVWMLAAGWLAASVINAMLTWWAVMMTMQAAPAMQNPLISAADLIKVAPVILACVVWLIRILIIGSLVVAASHPETSRTPERKPALQPAQPVPSARPATPVRPVSSVTSPTPISVNQKTGAVSGPEGAAASAKFTSPFLEAR